MKNLETKIEKLTVAIEALTEVIMREVSYQPEQQPVTADIVEKTVVQLKEISGVNEFPVYTHSDLKDLCLVKARANGDDRLKLKALLKEFGAVKAADVPENKLSEVIGRINAGEY